MRFDLKDRLKESIKEGDTVFTICRQVSRSGMYRHISVVVFRDGDPLHMSHDVAKLLGYPFKDKTTAVGVSGCGMDMGFHLVHSLSQELFGDGYALKQRWL
jgi:hypothetical protein